MRKLLITGGSGYLGSELVRQALTAGTWDVAATYTSNPREIAGVRFLPLDLRDAEAAAALVRALAPDVVIHTAYVQREPDLRAITAEGAGHVARAARDTGARLIHLSSDALFDGERSDSYTEDDPPSPITAYGEAKATAERLVASFYPAALIIRTSLIYGGSEPSQHEQTVFRAVEGTVDITFFTDERRNPIQVGDLVGALLELAPTDTQGILNIAGADVLSRYEFATLIAAHAGLPTAALRSGFSATSGMRRPRHVALDSSHAQALLHTRLRGAREVLPYNEGS